jgi:DNA-binding response OmpR family regulator
MNKVLICDDEPDIVAAISIYLESEGLEVLKTSNGKEALDIMSSETGKDVKLLLLDIMMPVMDGITAMAAIRKISNVPVILLTAKSEDADKIMGLNIGADDYVTKPFNPVELIARVRSQLRRYTQLGCMTDPKDEGTDKMAVGGIELDDKAKEVYLDGNKVSLTPIEYDILKLLMQHQGEVLSPKKIYEAVWHDQALGAESTVAVHVRHIREKIEYDSANPRYLKAVWGHGYKIES